MNLKSCFAALALSCASLCSQAGVLYEWRALDAETPRGITLQLEFDEALVASGAFSLVVEQDGFPDEPFPSSQLFNLRYVIPGTNGPRYLSYSSETGFSSGLGLLDIDLRFEAGGYLSGHILANDSEKHIELASMGRLFTVLDANSDEGMDGAGCEWAQACAGATGQIRRADVPEPATLALFAAGLLAATLRRGTARQSAALRP